MDLDFEQQTPEEITLELMPRKFEITRENSFDIIFFSVISLTNVVF